MADPDPHSHDDPFWERALTGQSRRRVWMRRIFRLISPDATERCHLCHAAFDGAAAPVMRTIGRGPWRRNPHFCNECERVFSEHRGGAEVEIAVLYADVRGSTRLAAGMAPAEFAALMQRFFIAATRILTGEGAAIDKMVGDEVIGLFLPGITGTNITAILQNGSVFPAGRHRAAVPYFPRQPLDSIGRRANTGAKERLPCPIS